MPSLSVVSKSGSHVIADVYGSVYSATVSVYGVSEAGTPVYTLAHGGSEAHGVLSGLTLPNKPKPLGQHRPPPLRSILMELYMLNRPNGRMILESVEQGPLIWTIVDVDGVTRPKKYS
nr:hypothetical protein [Tanacetum cinerariifolium]